MAYRKNKHYFTLRATGKKTIRVGIPIEPAKTPVSFFRTKEHVRKGLEGQACTCGNSEAALDNADKFPHEVHAVEFDKTRAYAVSKLDKHGQPRSGVFYEHNQDGFQDKYDRLGKRKMLQSPECEGIVTLNPPPKYSSMPGPRAPYPPSAKDGSRKAKYRKGAIARMERVGIIASSK